jgi:hypothetical protein
MMKFASLSARAVLPLACALTALAAQAAKPPAPSEHVPPPGLYRINDIDSEGKHNLPRGEVLKTEGRRDGASGDETHTSSVFGASGTSQVAGDGRTTMCIPAPKGELPQSMPAVPGCSSAPGVAVPGGMRATMHCAFGDTTITTRRLNQNTWQFESQTVVKQNQAGRGDAVSPMRAMLEAMAANGTPEEKRQAAAQMANLPKMEAQMAGVQRQRAAMAPQMAMARAGAAERGASFDANKPVSEQAVKYTITRIGDKCGG